MLRHATSSPASSKPVDFFRPLIVDVSVEYELPKEVAPPPGSAPLLIIHPSAYYSSRTKQSSSIPATSILSPSPIRTASFNTANSSSYYLRSANSSSNGSSNLNPPNIYQNPAPRSVATYSSTTSVSRSRSMSLAVGTGRRSQPQSQGQGQTQIQSGSSNSSINTTNCTDPNCDQCYVTPVPQDLMELDLTPSNHKSSSTASKRLRRDRENGLLDPSLHPQSQLQPQPLNLSAASMYLGPSLAYASATPPGLGPAHSVSNPLYSRKLSSGGSAGLALGPGGQNGIFQMINNVYAQQQQVAAAQSERLLLKEQGPKGSGSDSGVCSENESDVSPSTHHSSLNNNSSRRNLFAHEVSSGGGSSATACYCCCCPPTSGSAASDSPPRRNMNKPAPLSTTNSSSKSRGGGRTSRSSKSTKQHLQLIQSALPPPQLVLNHTQTHPYSSYLGLGLPSSPMDSSSGGNSNSDAMMIVPMDSSPAASYHHRAKWFVQPTAQDFGRWFQV